MNLRSLKSEDKNEFVMLLTGSNVKIKENPTNKITNETRTLLNFLLFKFTPFQKRLKTNV
jgi:hypothetical protein